MSRVLRHLLPESDGDSGGLGLFGEDRESFTQTFAYDHFQWPDFEVFGSVRPSVIDFRTPATRAAEERGLETGQDPAAPYTTTNSAIPIYKAGEVVPVEDGGEILPQTGQSGPVIGIDDYRADGRFSSFDGSGQAIVILDTGIDLDDPFFGPDSDGNGIADRIVFQYDFADNDGNAGDVDGHGSNVTSIAASSNGTYTGMAPGADIIALKVFSNSGSGNFADLEKALQWVVANAEAYNIVSVNMSLGEGGNYNTAVTRGNLGIYDELATLAAMDVIVVSASGNGFYELNSVQGVTYPAADPNSLSVGAVYDANTGGWSYGSGAIAYTTAVDRIAPFSQRDDTLSDIFAPGAAITGAGSGSALVTMHGTSQAAPHITGIAALAQQLAVEVLGRRLTFDEFQNLLQSSADFIVDGDDENDNVANTGLIFPRVNVANLADEILEMAWPGAETFFSYTTAERVLNEGDSGITGYTFIIQRSGTTTGSATIDYAVTGSGDNPASAADFNGGILPSGTLTFSSGQTSQTVTVYAATDSAYENDESFTLTLSNPSAGSGIIRSSASGTIVNDDSPVPGEIIALIDAGFDSGSQGFAFTPGIFGGTTSPAYISGSWTGDDIVIEMGGDPSSRAIVKGISGGWEQSFTLLEAMEVTLSFDYEILLSAGIDVKEYTRVLFSFGGGPTEVLTQVYGNGNGGSEDLFGPVTYEVDLGLLDAGTHSFVLGGYLLQRNAPDEYANVHFDNVSIEAVVPVPTDTFFSIATLNAVRDEGAAGSTDFTFTVTRSGNTTAADTVDYAVSGAGAGADDFTGGVYPSGTVSFAAGETSKIITVQVAGDSDYEASEGFTVTLSNASVGATITTASAGGTITNDDVLVPGEVIALVDSDFASGSDGFAFTPGIFGGTTNPAYISGSWTGDDIVIEMGGDPSSSAIVKGISGGWEQSFTLLEEMEVTLTFDYEILHSAGMEAKEYTEVRYSFDGGPVVVIEQVYGNGNGGSDDIIGPVTYEVDLGMLAAGTHSFVLGGHLLQRNAPGEYANVHFDNVSVEAVVPVPTETFLAVAALNAVRDEGDAGSTDFTFTVTRSGVTTGATTVDWTVSGAGAGAEDFAGGVYPSGTVSFASGEISKTVTVQVAGDTDYEASEGFTVTLSNPSIGSTITTASASGTITNDDILVAGEPIALIDAGFDSGSEGFAFTPGIFGGTTSPAYISGSWTGDDIVIEMGGDPSSSAIVKGISGGWEQSFTLVEEMEVTLIFDYEMLLSAGMDTKEYAEVRYSFDGGPVVVIEKVYGDGNGGPDDIIGPVTYEVDLGLLAAGNHSFVLGSYLLQRNAPGEYANVHFDNVSVEAVVPVPTGTSPDPLSAATISLEDLLVDGDDVLDPMSELLSGFGGDDSRLDDPAAPDADDIGSTFAAGLSDQVSGFANLSLSDMELLAGTGV